MSKKSKDKSTKKKEKMEDMKKDQQMEQEVDIKEKVSESAEATSDKQEEPALEEIDEVVRLSNELAEAKDKYLRLYSEFENFRRRTAKERLDLISTATQKLMTDLLPVIDDFERADKAFDEEGDIKGFKEGYDLIFNKFKNITEQNGLQVMKLDAGDDFNPELHDAVTQIPAPDEKLKGKVVDVLEKGYQMNDKVIRFAKVVTGS